MAIYKLNDIDKTKKSALAEFNVIHPARPQAKTLDHLITERTRFNLYPWWLKIISWLLVIVVIIVLILVLST